MGLRDQGGGAEREEFLRRAFEDAPLGIARIGLDGRLLDVNATLCAMLGRTREALLSTSLQAITHPEDREAEARERARLLREPAGTRSSERRYLRADGSVLMGRLSVSAVRSEAGAPLYLVGHLEDVTERRREAEAARAREARFRALVESATELFVVVAPGGRASFVSPAMEPLLGWTAEERVGRPFTEIVHEDERAVLSARLRSAFSRSGGTLRCVVRLLHRDGSPRRFALSVANHLEVEALGGLVLTLRDLTHEQTLEEQLSRARRLESIGRLAGGVAHDFNNQLGVILGFSELIEAKIRAGTPELEDILEVQRAAKGARELTRQLLAVGRQDSGEPRPVDVNESARRSERLLAKALGENVELVLDLAPEVGHALIDPAQLEQIVFNLATNARDAMPEGGRFTLRTRAIEEGHEVLRRLGLPPGAYVELTAEDDGEGMDPRMRDVIFEPFFTTKRPGHGTGLGLATVYGIVHQVGGEVWVESEPGAGARFHLLLPVATPLEPGEPEAAAAEAEPVAPAGGGDVLLVEDDGGMRRMIARTLRNAGYRVMAAAHAGEGLALGCEAASIDLIVTDVVMPGAGGRELVEKLEAVRGALPVIFVSGYAQRPTAERSDHRFLGKPFTRSALLAEVAHLLHRPEGPARRS